MLTIALLDVLSGSTAISARAHHGQVLAAEFGIVLLGLASMRIVAGGKLAAIDCIGLYSPMSLCASSLGDPSPLQRENPCTSRAYFLTAAN